MPMYLSMQREIEDYNSECTHQHRFKRKKRKRKKTKWKTKRRQMLEDPHFRPFIRNLEVLLGSAASLTSEWILSIYMRLFIGLIYALGFVFAKISADRIKRDQQLKHFSAKRVQSFKRLLLESVFLNSTIRARQKEVRLFPKHRYNLCVSPVFSQKEDR